MTNILVPERKLRWLALSDVHLPVHDPEAVAWALEQVADFQPHVLVLVGDLMESDAASRWPSEAEWDLEDEFTLADEMLTRLEEAKGHAYLKDGEDPLVYVEGNHEANLLAKHRIDKKLRRSVDYRTRIESLKRWRHYPYVSDPSKTVHRLGQVSFVHGFHTASTAAAYTAQTYGEEWGLTVYGHTHRPHDPERVKMGRLRLNRWAANSGCLVKLDPPPSFMERKDMGEWGQAIVRGECVPCRELRRGRFWEAETVVRQMAWTDPCDAESVCLASC